MTLRAVKQCVVVLLTLSTFTLHKQREDSNASPPSMNDMTILSSWNMVKDQINQRVLIQICGYAQEGFRVCTVEV